VLKLKALPCLQKNEKKGEKLMSKFTDLF
jgi:hypothetical protein